MSVQGIPKSDTSRLVEAFMSVIKDALSKGEDVHLRGFGTFHIKKRAEKKARNIAKDTVIIIPAHFVPRFKPADEFSERVKNSRK